MQEKMPHDACLDNIREKILILLVQHERLQPEQLSGILKASVEFSLFHLEELKRAGMVTDCRSPGISASWELLQDGRAYLAHHGLVS